MYEFCVVDLPDGGAGLYSRSTFGYLNTREGFGGVRVLLRAHGNEGPRPAPFNLPTTKLDLFRVGQGAVNADEEWWRAHVKVKGDAKVRTAGGGEGRGGAARDGREGSGEGRSS